MRKSFYMLFLICISVMLSGCGTKTLTCTKETKDNGSTTEEEIIVKFKKDKPITTSMEMNMEFSDEQKDYLDMTYSILESSSKDMEKEGVNIDIKKTDDNINYKMDIDFSKVKDDDNLSISFDKNDNLDSVKEHLEKNNYECK